MDGMLEVLRLVTSLEDVQGRKKLQKIVHILKSSGYDFPHYFGYLHYGPYSSGLTAEIDSLVSSKLVIEEGGGGEFEPYVYKPGPKAKPLLRHLGKMDAPPWAELAQQLNRRDANFLEALSTVLFLRRNGFKGGSLKARFKALKPNLVPLYDKALRSAASLPQAAPPE